MVVFAPQFDVVGWNELGRLFTVFPIVCIYPSYPLSSLMPDPMPMSLPLLHNGFLLQLLNVFLRNDTGVVNCFG